MTKQQLIETVASRTNKTKAEIEPVIESAVEAIEHALEAGERIDLRGFGSFMVKDRKARQGRNPKTGEPIAIAAKKDAIFKPGKELTQRLNKTQPQPAAQPEPVNA